MNFKDLLQRSKSTQGSHMSSYSLNSYDILEPGKATCYLSSICSTHRGPSEVPPYWNNLLSRVLKPILLLLENTNRGFIVDSLSLKNDRSFSSFLSNPCWRAQALILNIYIYVPPALMWSFFVSLLLCLLFFINSLKAWWIMISTSHITPWKSWYTFYPQWLFNKHH